MFLMERMLKSVAEIAMTHSHQSVLTKYTHEALDFVGLTFTTLENEVYPTGYLYHHDKHYLAEMLAFSPKVRPAVFHMCWTESRIQKVQYFKTIGMWYLSTDNSTCYSLDSVTKILTKEKAAVKNENEEEVVLETCCTAGDYWVKRRAYDQEHLNNSDQSKRWL
jgi:hypothetical protein